MDRDVASSQVERSGRRLGRYDVLAGLSTGGMAELYLGALVGPGDYRKLVAIKKILPEVQANEAFARMFRDEARVSSRLTHVGIAQPFELGDSDEGLFLAIEFVLGIDLARVLRTVKKSQRQLPIGFSCKVVHDLCLALDAAHRHVDDSGAASPVIHRDVNPRNLMVSFDGFTKVIDFGVALAKDRLERTGNGLVKGTVAYMSPEQLRGDRLDGRTDLYAAGAVLHEILTGERLFSAQSDLELMQKVSSGIVPSATELNPKVPRQLADVVQKALSRDRERRFASGRDMATALIGVAGELFFSSDRVANYLRSAFRDRFSQLRSLISRSPPATDEVPELTTDPGVGEVTEPKAEVVTPESRAHQTVLLVDDDPEALLALQKVLKQESYRVISCAFPEKVASLVAEHPPSAVLIGAKPSGFDVCRQLRALEIDEQPPVILLAKNISLEQRTRGLEAGGDDFVRVPPDPVDLCRHVSEQIQAATTLRAMLAPHRWRRPKP